MAEIVRRKVIVHGRVQGVFFRDTLRRQASSAGVGGYAENRPDGTVEAAFEGAPDAVERMVRLCHDGPRGAKVDHVEEVGEEPRGESTFRVR